MPDLSYLVIVLRNLVLGENNELKYRYLHVGFKSAKPIGSKVRFETLNINWEERVVLNSILSNARII